MSDLRHHETLEDGNRLQVVVTDEGLIIDLFNPAGDEVLATFAKTFDELAEFLDAPRPDSIPPVVPDDGAAYVVRIGNSSMRVTTTDAEDLIAVAATARQTLQDLPVTVHDLAGGQLAEFAANDIDDWWA